MLKGVSRSPGSIIDFAHGGSKEKSFSSIIGLGVLSLMPLEGGQDRWLNPWKEIRDWRHLGISFSDKSESSDQLEKEALGQRVRHPSMDEGRSCLADHLVSKHQIRVTKRATQASKFPKIHVH
jgi:hypothetical protein